MPGYDEVNEILHARGWNFFAKPEPNAVNEALQTLSVAAVVDALDAVVEASTPLPYPSYDQSSSSIFSENGHFWTLNTRQALGLAPLDPPVENIGRALLVEEWIDHMQHGYTRQGYRDGNCGPDSEQGKLRRAAAVAPPASFKGYEDIWWLACVAGYIPVGLTGFSPAYAQTSPKISEIRGLDAQKWLENLTYLDLHPGDLQHIPWPPQKPVTK